MVKAWGRDAFRNIFSMTVSFGCAKQACGPWSRASWPLRGVKGFSEEKVVGGGIVHLYLGIWSAYVGVSERPFKSAID